MYNNKVFLDTLIVSGRIDKNKFDKFGIDLLYKADFDIQEKYKIISKKYKNNSLEKSIKFICILNQGLKASLNYTFDKALSDLDIYLRSTKPNMNMDNIDEVIVKLRRYLIIHKYDINEFKIIRNAKRIEVNGKVYELISILNEDNSMKLGLEDETNIKDTKIKSLLKGCIFIYNNKIESVNINTIDDEHKVLERVIKDKEVYDRVYLPNVSYNCMNIIDTFDYHNYSNKEYFKILETLEMVQYSTLTGMDSIDAIINHDVKVGGIIGELHRVSMMTPINLFKVLSSMLNKPDYTQDNIEIIYKILKIENKVIIYKDQLFKHKIFVNLHNCKRLADFINLLRIKDIDEVYGIDFGDVNYCIDDEFDENSIILINDEGEVDIISDKEHGNNLWNTGKYLMRIN